MLDEKSIQVMRNGSRRSSSLWLWLMVAFLALIGLLLIRRFDLLAKISLILALVLGLADTLWQRIKHRSSLS